MENLSEMYFRQEKAAGPPQIMPVLSYGEDWNSGTLIAFIVLSKKYYSREETADVDSQYFIAARWYLSTMQPNFLGGYFWRVNN